MAGFRNANSDRIVRSAAWLYAAPRALVIFLTVAGVAAAALLVLLAIGLPYLRSL